MWVCVCACLSVYLSVSLCFCLFVCKSFRLSVYLSVCLCVCLSVYLSFCLSVFSAFLSFCLILSVCLSVCVSLSVMVYMLHTILLNSLPYFFSYETRCRCVSYNFNGANGTVRFKNVNSCLNTKVNFYLQTSGGQNPKQ